MGVAFSGTYRDYYELQGEYLWKLVSLARLLIIPFVLMSSPDPKSRALKETSLSLLDMRAAVEWVHENIEAFGGDPENIFVSLHIN